MSSDKPFWNRRRHLSLPVAAVALLASLSSHASAVADQQRVVVFFPDLNLQSEGDLQVLRRRIHRAAETVCGTPESRDLYEQMRYRDCVEDATDRALAEVRARSK